jgi:hypothetical protein
MLEEVFDDRQPGRAGADYAVGIKIFSGDTRVREVAIGHQFACARRSIRAAMGLMRM